MTLQLYFPDEDGWHNERDDEGNILLRTRDHSLRAHTRIIQTNCGICYGHGNLGTLSLEMNKLTDEEAFELGLENWDHSRNFDKNDGICKPCNGHGYHEIYICTVCNSQNLGAWCDCEGPRPAIQ